MWREFLQELPGDCEFYSAADNAAISTAQDALGVRLPAELIGLLSESDGVTAEYGLGLVWSVDRIRTENLDFRSNHNFRELYMPFDHLLFFSDDGCGNQFVFVLNGGVIRRPDIFVWDHEDDSRYWTAPSLRLFLDWWRTGRLKF